MNIKQIIFPRPNCAELVEKEIELTAPNEVLVRTEVSTISPGTERANIIGDANVAGRNAPDTTFPRSSGYNSAGVVVAVGEAVTSVAPGDRVVVYWGKHRDYNLVPEEQVVKMPDGISFEEGALSFIATFPLAAIRKCRLEIGEPAMVMGLGLLGQLAIRLLRAAGAYPVIGVDPVASRREEAVQGGADYVFDPFAEGFAAEVKRVTGGGAKVCIEVTGVGAGMDGALDCMAKFGRMALLGCTRDKEFNIDYYRKVHCPGITLIGAHTLARPKVESHPGYFTHRDDINAVLQLQLGGRLDFKPMLTEKYAPAECAAVYERIINDRSFPTVAQFDWKK
ncbi:MAG: zinc-binding alcohol dehydrogenase [Ruminococcaceae bacterium]|nr:zinc-binding alcohol dehydrogenase [Oscillospiraceae bacterium]